LHVIASLLAEARSRLPGAVAAARDQDDLSWSQIADLLGTTRASAWERYAGRATQGPAPLGAR
jgi:DNA-binding transcriptional regulator YiaG